MKNEKCCLMDNSKHKNHRGKNILYSILYQKELTSQEVVGDRSVENPKKKTNKQKPTTGLTTKQNSTKTQDK